MNLRPEIASEKIPCQNIVNFYTEVVKISEDYSFSLSIGKELSIIRSFLMDFDLDYEHSDWEVLYSIMDNRVFSSTIRNGEIKGTFLVGPSWISLSMSYQS